MNHDEKKLYELCHFLAKDRKWQRKPYDSKEIEELAQFYYDEAVLWAPINMKSESKDLRQVYGAIEVLISSISGPNHGDAKVWFTESLQMLLFLANPCSRIESEEGLEFLSKLELGINELRGENA